MKVGSESIGKKGLKFNFGFGAAFYKNFDTVVGFSGIAQNGNTMEDQILEEQIQLDGDNKSLRKYTVPYFQMNVKYRLSD